MRRIFLVEDESVLCTLLEKYLVHEGYDVTTFTNGTLAMNAIKSRPDLWILDINLPGYSGYDLISEIKKDNKDIPVIFMSARNEELDRVIGLELGSDDYLPKPFLPRELVIRTKNIIDKVYGSEHVIKDSTYNLEENINIGCYTIHTNERIVIYKDEIIQLTTKEFELLMYFVRHKQCVITRQQILLGVWGDNYFGSDRVVDDTVRRLRKKLPKASPQTIYGYGYKWSVI